jgi:hypothetical protein
MTTWIMIVSILFSDKTIGTRVYVPTTVQTNTLEHCTDSGVNFINFMKQKYGDAVIVSFDCAEIKYDDILKSLPPEL